MSKQPEALRLADALAPVCEAIQYCGNGAFGVETVGPIRDSAAELRRLHALNEELLEVLKGMVAIVDDSRGVAGYHLNGDTAEWDEFDEVDAANAAIAKAEAA